MKQKCTIWGHSRGWGVNASHVPFPVFPLYTNTAHTNNNSDGELWRSVAWKDAYDTFWQLFDTWFLPFYMYISFMQPQGWQDFLPNLMFNYQIAIKLMYIYWPDWTHFCFFARGTRVWVCVGIFRSTSCKVLLGRWQKKNLKFIKRNRLTVHTLLGSEWTEWFWQA